MRACVLVALATFFAPTPEALTQESSDSLATASHLAEQQHQIAQAIVRGNWRLLDSLYASEYVFIDGLGTVWPRTAVFGEDAAGAVRTAALSYKNLSVRLYGATAIITGIATVTIHYQRGTYVGDSRFTRIHIRRGDRWQVALYHVTRITARDTTRKGPTRQQPNGAIMQPARLSEAAGSLRSPTASLMVRRSSLPGRLI